MNILQTVVALSVVLQHTISQPVYNVAHKNFATTTSTAISTENNFDLAAVNDGFMTVCRNGVCPV
jgi:hypothetical protein